MDKLFEELGIEQEVKTLEELELVNNFVLIENRILNRMLEEKDAIIRSLEIQLNSLIELNEENDKGEDYQVSQECQYREDGPYRHLCVGCECYQECHQDDDENESSQDDESIPQNIRDFLKYIQENLGDSIDEIPLPLLKQYIKSVAPMFGLDANSVDISMNRGV